MRGLRSVFFIFTFLVIFGSSQTLEEKYVIDDFSVIQECVVTLQSDLTTQDPNVVQTTFATGSTNVLIGGERDMEMRVFEGFQGRRFSSEIFPINGGAFYGEWTISNPKTASSLATNQYDGVDDSFDLNFNGLNVNLNNATHMTFLVISDIDTTVVADFFDTNGNICSGSILVPGLLGNFYDYSYDVLNNYLDLSSLVGNCERTDIGAIEISLQADDAIDSLFRRITLDSLAPNISPTPTPTPSPSFSLQLEEKYVIDDFSVIQECVVTLQSDLTTQDPNEVQTTFATGTTSALIGGERDMEMRVFEGFQARRFSSEVFEISGGYFLGEWAIANPKSASSLATNQYDGVDDSFDINFNGLNVNLNDATHLKISVVSDISATYVVNFFDTNGNACTGSITVLSSTGSYSYDETKTYLALNSLVGNCNRANIGAIEISLQADDAIDSVIRKITLDGPLPQNISPTPSPTVTLQLEEKYLIDDFSVIQECVVTLQSDVFSTSPNVVQTTTATGPTSALIGGERDMEMRVFEGFVGRRFSSDVFATNNGYSLGEWSISNPKTSNSLATNQYDGIDGSFDLTLSGLNVNLNNVTHMVIDAISDIDATYVVDFFDTTGNICSGSISVPASLGFRKRYLELSSLTGNCNQANIGAIEIGLRSEDAFDSIVRRISLSGPIVVSPSLTHTPSTTSTRSLQSPTPTPTNVPQLEDVYVIDDFTVVQECTVTLSNDVSSQNPNTVQTTSATGPTTALIGGERDMEVRVFEGFQGRRFDSFVVLNSGGYFNGEWAISNSKSSSSVATNQYDGVDGSFSLNLNGLNVNLNDVTYLIAYAVSDIDVTYNFDFYDTNGISCSISMQVDSFISSYTNEETKQILDLSSLFGNCDKSNIGAIEISLPSNDANDSVLRKVSLAKLVNTNASPTLSQTLTPTPSQTPTQTLTPTPTQTFDQSPSQTLTSNPSQTPSPTQVLSQTPSQTIIDPEPTGTPTTTPVPSTTPTLTRTPAPIVSTVVTQVPVILNQPETNVTVGGESIVFGENSVVTIAGVTRVLPDALAVASSAVDVNLFDENGNAKQPDGDVIICFPPVENSDLERYCLAYLDEQLNTWVCDNDNIENVNGELCSTTNHFTIFALIDRTVLNEMYYENSYSLVSSRTTVESESFSSNSLSFSSYSTGGFSYSAPPDYSVSSNGFILSISLTLTVLGALVWMI